MNAEREYWRRTRAEFTEFVLLLATLAAAGLGLMFWSVILNGGAQ